MGGVDQHDWLVGKYSVGIRGKKWYWPLFIRILDMTMVNAWAIYMFVTANDDKEILSLLDFKRQVCISYLKGADHKETTGRKSKVHQKLQLMLDLIVRNIFCRSVINNGGARTKTIKANQEHTATSAM